MTKITRTIANKEETVISVDNTGGNTLKKTEIQITPEGAEPKIDPPLLPPQYATTPEVSDVALWLFNFVERDIIQAIRKNPYLQLSYSEPKWSDEEWLIHALKTIMPSYESIEVIGQHIQQKIVQVRQNLQNDNTRLQQQLLAKDKEIEQLEKRLALLTTHLDSAELAKFKLEKNLAVSIDVKTVVSAFFYDEMDILIKDIFLEATDNVTKDLAQFIAHFIPEWVSLKQTLKKMYPTEQEHMKAVHTTLSLMLQALSGLYIAQRRTLLDKIARLSSDYFNDYLFISPEESLQVDMTIHNAQGLGGTMIREGITFAVLRKTTRQTLIYADIAVH